MDYVTIMPECPAHCLPCCTVFQFILVTIFKAFFRLIVLVLSHAYDGDWFGRSFGGVMCFVSYYMYVGSTFPFRTVSVLYITCS